MFLTKAFGIRLQYHVIEQTRLLPAYSMYCKVDIRDVKQPNGHVTFLINERIQRVRNKISFNIINIFFYS
jgi:hypothetical protein